jgi:sensor histidine kinase YesM
MIDMTVIYQYVSAISMLSGSKYALQNKLKLVEQEVEMARVKMSISQMKPHFLYNALTTIQTIIKVDPDYASNLIYDFTIHLRGTINALSSDSPIPFMKEMANVMAYLNIEKARFGDSLKIVQDIQDEDFNIIPLSIQPLAENAARHGIRPKGKEGGTIYIRSYALPDCHVIEVEDDGVGFDYDEIKNSHSTDDDAHKPVGIENLIFRLKTLMNADVIINSEPGRGTKITIKLPKSDDGC